MQRRQVMRSAAAGVAGIAGGKMLGVDPAGALPAGGRGHGRLDDVGLVFLSHVNDPATTSLFPGDPEFVLETMTTVPVDGFYMQYVMEGEHTGTHWGSAAHFQEGGLTTDQLDPEDLFLPAVVVDVRAQAAADTDYGVTVADLRAWERRYGRMPHEAAVIMWSGWEDRWGTDAYANLDAEGVIHQPGFTLEAAEWLLERGVLGRRGAIGSDTFSADRGIDVTFSVSLLLYQEHRLNIENMANLAALPARGAHVLCGGPRHKNGSGATSTIFGLIPAR